MLYIETNEAWKQDKTLVIPVYEDKKLPARLTEALDHDLSNEINAKAGCLSTISTLGRLPMQTICFIGMGNSETISYADAKRYFGIAAHAYPQSCLLLDEALCTSLDKDTAAKAAGYASVYSTYRFAKINKAAE